MMMGITGNVSGRHIKNRDNSAALVKNTSVGVVGLMLVLVIGTGTMNMNNVTADAAWFRQQIPTGTPIDIG